LAAGGGNDTAELKIVISLFKPVAPISGSECAVHNVEQRVANATDLIGAGVAKLGPGAPAAPAIPHTACAGEAEWGWWGGGRSVPPLEHLTALHCTVWRGGRPGLRTARH